MTTITPESAAFSLHAAATHLKGLESAVKRGDPLDPEMIAEARTTVSRYLRIVRAMERDAQRVKAGRMIAEIRRVA